MKKPDDNSAQNISRRDALAKLAKLSAYTAPSVITLLTAEQSHAQSSEALMNLNNGQINNWCSMYNDFGGTQGNDTSGGFGGWFGTNGAGDC